MRYFALFLGIGVTLLAYVPRVDADEPALFDQLTAPTTRPEHCPPRAGYFDGLASACHVWEIRTDTGFGAERVLTERLEVASAIPIFRQTFALVLRTTASVDSQTTTGFYGIHGPIWSVGFRNRSPENNYWIEAGVRLVPGWAGPKDDQPQALQLAYQAAITSGVGDDARWLPFSGTGTQVYMMLQSRGVIGEGAGTTLIFGALYGGQVSLAPMQIQSWLGPQNGVIGNALVELYAGAPRLAHRDIRVQIGVHADVSLSSIWPGDESLPMHLDGYFGWNPLPGVIARFFYGFAGSPLGSWTNPYGMRVEYFFR